MHGLDPASGPKLKDELFTRHLQTTSIDGKAKDQLTAELQDFVHCAQTGTKPQVNGDDGRAAIALAERIQESLRAHRWNGPSSEYIGPAQLPPSLGPLFKPLAA